MSVETTTAATENGVTTYQLADRNAVMTVIEDHTTGRWSIECGPFKADLPMCVEDADGDCTALSRTRKVCTTRHSVYADVSWSHDEKHCHGWHRVRVNRVARDAFESLRRQA